MQHPDEGMIHTWLDGELSAEEAAALESHVAECEECKASVAEARGFIAASSRIIGTLGLAADLGRDGPPDRLRHRRRPAGFGAMGDRPPGRDQPRAWRRIDGRDGARRAQILTRPNLG